jgi:hypothetical protein
VGISDICDTVPRSVDVIEMLAGATGLLSEYDGGFNFQVSKIYQMLNIQLTELTVIPARVSVGGEGGSGGTTMLGTFHCGVRRGML